MKRILAGIAVAVCVFGGAGLARAQQAAEPELYVVISYFKTAPGMQDAYREFVTGTSKKFYEEMLKEQPTLVHWSVARVVFTGVDGPGYDYVGAAVYAGPPPEPKTYPDAMYQKASGMTRVDYMKKLEGLRTALGSELVRSVARLAAPGTLKEGDFRVANQLRVTPGMGDEFTAMIRTMTQPMMDARRTAGELKSWSMWTRVFPAGVGTPYDALQVSYFKDLASAVKGLDGTKTPEYFGKANPGKNYGTYVNNVRDYAQSQFRGVHQVVALVERPAAARSRRPAVRLPTG